jgi:UPF0755 protein
MKAERKRPPFFLILFFLITVFLVVFMMFVVHTNTKALGLPGENVSWLNNLRYSFRLWRSLDRLQTPVAFPNGEEKKFVITQNESAGEVCKNLSREALPGNPLNVCDYMIYKGYDRALSPGTYTIASGRTPVQIMDWIADGRNRDIQFTIFEGWRIEEIAATIDLLGFPFNGEEFLAEVRQPSENLVKGLSLPEEFKGNNQLEGYFAPGAYSLKPSTDLSEFIAHSVNRTPAIIADILKTQGEPVGDFSLHDRMILASIIQRETLDEAEMLLIASVFYNRLQVGMKLETDPTVQYGLGFDPVTQSWWKTPLTLDDLANPSDYNTYIISGLPIGPISNPGREAIAAAFYPAQSNYYFFRAKCDGSLTHNFAETYEQHLANGCE